MKKLFTILLLPFFLFACDTQTVDLDQGFRADRLVLDSKNLCDYVDCTSCSDTDPRLNPCPEDPQESEGFGCCSLDLTFCVPVGLNPDGSCPGIYMWCDYFEVNPDGSMDCWDIFGQG